MKFFHISDLHLGKKVYKESMLQAQEYILDQILEAVSKENPNALLITGDIYDKPVPSPQAVQLLDDFLWKLQNLDIDVFMISGNHDSGERLFFGKRIFATQRIHIGAMFHGCMEKICLQDEYGDIYIHMLPFIKPAMVQPYFEDKIETYDQMVRKVIDIQDIDGSKRNILLGHQYVTWQGEHPQRSESEQISLGGLDEVDASVFQVFDYTALGHIHRPQRIGDMTVRYAGSPLKYSFSEVNHKKAITCVTIKEKSDIEIRKLPLEPQKDLAVLKDTLENLLSDKYIDYRSGYYLSITLTDHEKVLDPVGQLRAKFDGILEFHIDREQARSFEEGQLTTMDLKKQSPMNLFEDFYKKQNNLGLTDIEYKILKEFMHGMQEEYVERTEEE